MPLPTQINANDHVYQATLSAITAATVTYVGILNPGRIKQFCVTPTAATATASATFQLAYAPPGSSTFTNVANGLITLASGTAAGLNTKIEIPPSTDAYVIDGGTLRVTTGGTATGGGTPQCTLLVGV